MVEHSRATLDLTYGALAHQVRREMLELLRADKTRVTDLADSFDISLAASSKHIHVLERAGLITRSISGRDHILSLEPHPLVEASDWIDAYRSFWEARVDALEAHFRGRRKQ